MAIETQPESAQAPGGGDPGATPKQRNFWLSPGIHTAVIGAVIGYLFGHWLGNFIAGELPAVGRRPTTTTSRSCSASPF